MPKASKKKQKKAEDFKKVKLKVGKKKAPPSNATDTSFTAKSIVLTGQSITIDKGSQLTNSRNLSLKDILSQLRHYSAVTRKEALTGMADLLSLHPQLVSTELGPIIEGTVRLIVDNEPVVRKNLLQLYGKFLRQVSTRDLVPFVQLLVVFTCSAMSHILEDIRADAVKFLDLLVEIAPESVTQFSSRVLPNFYSLLETNTQSSDKKIIEIKSRTTLLTQGSRIAIMRSCYNYLAAYTRPLSEHSDPLWFMGRNSCAARKCRSIAATTTASNSRYILRTCADCELYFFPNDPSPFSVLSLFGESTEKAESAGTKSSTKGKSNSTFDKATIVDGTVGAADKAVDYRAAIVARSREALNRLFPFLQATWMEASTMFGTGQIAADNSLKLCTFVVQILQTLWRAAYAEGVPPDNKDVVGFLRQCMVYFPFGDSYIGKSEVEEALLSLNIKTCELVALVQLGAAKYEIADSAAIAEAAKWTKRTTKTVLQTLGMRTKKQTKAASGAQFEQVLISSHFRHEYFVELLPVVWQMVRGASEKDAEQLLVAIFHYADTCHFASASKTLCIQFLCKIIETQWSRTPVDLGTLDLSLKWAKDIFSKWACGLPKLLWQLRNQNLEASMAAAEALRLIHQRTRLLDSAASAALQAGLATLFYVDVPGKGMVYGPFKQYPAGLQRTVLEIISYSTAPSKRLVQAIRVCIAEKSPTDQVRVFVDEILG
ncbi:rRNA processing protein [Coemansia sp. RSA 1813]|nr:rRNA processing protein [Coemansia sp. RSA 1843]KAJ2086922.1 rRNA processing protein [Coemansia sp. RSA 986]KAJ2565178.1 rRNA processing protein [Coemansia sp. RSA 1813]